MHRKREGERESEGERGTERRESRQRGRETERDGGGIERERERTIAGTHRDVLREKGDTAISIYIDIEREQENDEKSAYV